MLIPPKYEMNDKIVELLQSIEGSREVIDSVDIPPEIENNIRRASTLSSSIFSARIEGSALTVEDYNLSSSTQKKAEANNILKALNFVYQSRKKDISEAEIFKLHELSLSGLVPPDQLGRLRRENSATFNSAGIAIYMHPIPRFIKPNIKKLIAFANSNKEKFVPIRSALVHYSFEKIHPFLDGNGRVGRLVMHKVLHHGGYGMKGLLPIEEFIDNHRNEYYRALEEPEKEVTDYIVFMLTAISETASKIKDTVINKKQVNIADLLLPRRGEIYILIKEHKIMSFNQISRRFQKVNARTLRYDLQKLQEKGLIVKLGNTKGVYYRLASEK